MVDIFKKFRKENGDILLDDHFLVVRKIGKFKEKREDGNWHDAAVNLGRGSFGDVYLVKCASSGRSFAIKVEHEKLDSPLWSLSHEYNVYQSLKDGLGFPETYGFYQEENFHWFSMELLGPTLFDLLSRCNKRFSIKTTLMLADQFLERIEYVHRQGYIHRDIKPSNMMMGNVSEKSSILYLADFGLAKRYRDPKTGSHIGFARDKPMTGTMIYNSINAMKRYELSRRDDIESIAYVLIYMAKGSLPWHRLMAKTSAELEAKVLAMKEMVSLEELCDDLPEAFIDYLEYARKLKFDERPDYDMLRHLFLVEFRSAGYVFDYIYDWNLLESNLRAITRAECDRCHKSKGRQTARR